MKPGEIILKDNKPIEINEGRTALEIEVSNTGDRPIQVGSHYHFYEVNNALKFDREKCKGFRLDIAAGTGMRFEPGQTRKVSLVSLPLSQRSSALPEKSWENWYESARS